MFNIELMLCSECEGTYLILSVLFVLGLELVSPLFRLIAKE
jgi:hypothetical protein